MTVGKGESGPYDDYPFDDVVREAEALGKAGYLAFQKYSCGECGQRLTMESPGMFYTKGQCDRCGAITDIKATGCNYMLIKFPGKKET